MPRVALSDLVSPVLPGPWINPAERTDASADVDIMERVRAGEEQALGELLDRYWKLLVKYSIGFVEDVDSAEDIVQEAFLRVWRGRAKWTPTGTVRAYLYRIVRNLALQERKKRGVRRRFSEMYTPLESPPTPAEDLEQKRLRKALSAVMATLSPRRREVLELARFHDLSYKQIADVMGISVQTVANQMSSALRDCRKALNP